MSSFLEFVGPAPQPEDSAASVAAADACLERFTSAFNARDTAAMDAELHFPHLMLSGGALLVWDGPGMHPQDLFTGLEASGWAQTKYTEKEPVLASQDKLHFRVAYDRLDGEGRVLSRHVNLWVVTRKDGRWGIALRSY